MNPNYISLYNSGELERRADILLSMLKSCTICPRNCKVNRTESNLLFFDKGKEILNKGEIKRGVCKSGYKPIVSSFLPHFGEEPPISGTRGSGTIFFANCNLKCVYCQNYQISQNYEKQAKNEIDFSTLADIMIQLQNRGCHNINFVSPTHFVPQIVKALCLAVPRGLKIPLVYNTNSYDSIETLKLLDGVIDIYLPDIKYSDPEMGEIYSNVNNYVFHSRKAIKEMYRQVGNLVLDKEGIAIKGLILRHLVLPNDIAGSYESLKFVRDELSKDIFLSVMCQYYPTNIAEQYPLISRKIRESEYYRVLDALDELELEQGWVQDFDSPEYYLPDFDAENPFTKKQ